jgi:hypothetical protein
MNASVTVNVKISVDLTVHIFKIPAACLQGET